ncbi:hypothetical protein [Bosea robiniae]|uniref:Glycosyl hydrolase n=1 Tax=Bosea robiniae TaxID=1036780 RepID=A0ABY0P1E8_9HYPH|nr:hypothetical protein [Bosea robiniae]SDG72923.1 hypothetical protein SAMN05421844_105104 [Bosea robiniae]
MRKKSGMIGALAWLVGLALAASAVGQTPELSKGQSAKEIETVLLARALESAGKYARPTLYRFAPQRRSDERAASTVAVTAHLLLEAYRAGGGDKFLNMARQAGDDLLVNADLDNDGKIGWGRFWSPAAGTSRPGDGSNTTFSRNCTLPRNGPYADELYDDARIGHFLLDLHQVTSETRFSDAVKAMLTATWNLGAPIPGGGFYYFKTKGPCDAGFHVKNINMMMAAVLALANSQEPNPRYAERLATLLRAEHDELNEAQGSANLAYYGRGDDRVTERGGYISVAQVNGSKGWRCRVDTGSGNSCFEHLGLEARALALIGAVAPKALRRAGLGAAKIREVMAAAASREAESCQGGGRWPYSATFCAAYHCALRQVLPASAALCLDRTSDPKSWTQDVTLGLFWGRPNGVLGLAEGR